MPPPSWRRTRRKTPVGLGCNCAIFETARTWAYRELRHHFGNSHGFLKQPADMHSNSTASSANHFRQTRPIKLPPASTNGSIPNHGCGPRSEERRVGKERRDQRVRCKWQQKGGRGDE